MKISDKHYIITEHGGFLSGGPEKAGFHILHPKQFESLESFILENRNDSRTDPVELLSLSARRGGTKAITAKNYVGVIAMKDGTVIEILPKIFGKENGEERERVTKTKNILLDMLRTLNEIPYKEFDPSSVKTERINLLEIFILMFVNEAHSIVKLGLKSDYNTIEENERFFKGKLVVAQNIKYNHSNKARFHIRYDEFNVNRPENRLIKVTLKFLYKKSTYERNKQSISRLLSHFESVEDSTDNDADFNKCVNNRSMSRYERALKWCKVFLRGKSFTAYAGNDVAIALLFPMEVIFESYVASILRRKFKNTNYVLRTQDRRFCLFENPKKFSIRPDIVLSDGCAYTIVDTKWKLLSERSEQNYGISQSDMYQVYAYGKKYALKKSHDSPNYVKGVILIYPFSANLADVKNIQYDSGDGVTVHVLFIDLASPTNPDEMFNELCKFL